MGIKKYLPVLALLLAVVGTQLLTRFTDSAFYLTQLTMTAYYSVVILGLGLLMGYAGQISLGHAGFFAIGGYLSAALTTHNFAAFEAKPLFAFLIRHELMTASQDIFGDTILSFHPWPAAILAILATAFIAFVIGIPVLKLRGHYLAMATLGFGIIIYRLVLATSFFGEADGISEVPGFTLLPGVAVSGDFDARVSNYYIAWSLVTAGALLLLNLLHSRVGRALRAIHGAEDAANAMGINTARYKLSVFVLSAVLAGVAGILLTHYNGGIGPSEAGVMKSVRYVAIVAVGGMASLWGTLFMSVVLNFMSLRGMFGSFDDAVFGAILILIMLLAPHGVLRVSLWPGLRQVFTRLRPHRRDPR